MYSRVWLALAIFLTMFLFASLPASADGLPVGVISFDLLNASGPAYGLDLQDLTQPNGGSPVSTFLSFSALTLDVVTSAGTMTQNLTAQDAFSDFSTGAVFAAGDLLSATLSGSFSLRNVMLADGSLVKIESSFSAVITDPSGGPLQDGDLALIDVTPIVKGVPEPGTLALLGVPLVVLVGRVRKASRFPGRNYHSSNK